jgi:hypothetical protein
VIYKSEFHPDETKAGKFMLLTDHAIQSGIYSSRLIVNQESFYARVLVN